MSVPLLARVRQSIPQPRVADVAATVRTLILESRLRERVPAGGRVAVGVGSRGITCIPTVARAAVDAIRELGFRPFIVAAMGSHGGATAEGQRELLAGYGVTPESMGVEVRSDMETVVVGTNHVGLPIYFDKNAHGADGIVVMNRVKPHTDFRFASHESGVLKMMVIGLGKREGASQIHKLGTQGDDAKCSPPSASSSSSQHPVRARGCDRRKRRRPAGRDCRALEPETLFDVEPVLLLDRARGR